MFSLTKVLHRRERTGNNIEDFNIVTPDEKSEPENSTRIIPRL